MKKTAKRTAMKAMKRASKGDDDDDMPLGTEAQDVAVAGRKGNPTLDKKIEMYKRAKGKGVTFTPSEYKCIQMRWQNTHLPKAPSEVKQIWQEFPWQLTHYRNQNTEPEPKHNVNPEPETELEF